MFGAYGLHWIVWDSAYTERLVMEKLPGATDAQLNNQLAEGRPDTKEVARALLARRDEQRQFYRNYEGQEIKWGPCPQYQAAIERNRNGRSAA